MRDMAFSNRLQVIIEAKRETINSFGAKLGTSFTTVKNYIDGRDPSFQFVQKILRMYPDVSSDWLILGEGNIFKSSPTGNSVSINTMSGGNAVAGNNASVESTTDQATLLKEKDDRIAELMKDKEHLTKLVELLMNK